MSVEEDHVHKWRYYEGTFICLDWDCPTIMDCEDVAARLNHWIDLDNEAWKRRVKGMRQRLEVADGGT